MAIRVDQISPGTAAGAEPPTTGLESLMDAYLAGDTKAFEQIFARLSPRVAGYLRGMCGDPRLAEDLTQTTFLKVHRARDTYQRGAPVEPWVFAIARRSLLDHRRGTRRRPEALSADGSVPEPEQEPEAPEDEGFERLGESQARVLRERLASLPESQREALVLLKVRGLSTAEAAAVAGTTQGAIKLRAHRAYESLRKILGVGGPGGAGAR